MPEAYLRREGQWKKWFNRFEISKGWALSLARLEELFLGMLWCNVNGPTTIVSMYIYLLERVWCWFCKFACLPKKFVSFSDLYGLMSSHPSSMPESLHPGRMPTTLWRCKLFQRHIHSRIARFIASAPSPAGSRNDSSGQGCPRGEVYHGTGYGGLSCYRSCRCDMLLLM